MALAEERKVDALAAGLLSVAAFMTVTPYSVGEAYAVGANWLGGANIISGLLLARGGRNVYLIVHRNWVIGYLIAFRHRFRALLSINSVFYYSSVMGLLPGR